MTRPSAETRDPIAELEALLTSATRGEYEIEGLLGRGGMAAVFRARDLQLDRPVAIKILPPEYTFGRDLVERFRREARTAAQLNHPNIIPIYRIGEAGPTLYFVMKLVEGRSLESIIRDLGALDPSMVAAIIAQVCAPVDYAHRRGVIHRDLKPSNVMIDEEGYAVVMDFGIAKAADNMAITATGAALGTPYYMSPEQCAGKPVTGASDQYAIAVMAYQMLTGSLPFEGESVQEIISKHFFEEPPSLASLRPDLSHEVHTAVHRGMAKRPEDRFPSLVDFAAALGSASAGQEEAVRDRMQLLSQTHTGERRVVTPRPPVQPVRTPPKAPPAAPTRRDPQRAQDDIPTEVVARPSSPSRPRRPPPPVPPTPATPLPAAGRGERRGPAGAPAPGGVRRRRTMIGIAAGVLVVTGAGLGAILGSRSDAPAATPAEAVEDSPPPGEDETQVPARDQPPPEEPVAAAAPPRETARPTAGQTATPPPALDQVRLPTVDPSRITTPEVRVPAAAQPPAQQGAEPPPLPTITVDPNALGAAPQAATLQITDPVPGLIVLINGERVQLDSGQVQLPPGEYTVTLSAPGYVSRTRTYTLAAGSMRALPGALRRQ